MKKYSWLVILDKKVNLNEFSTVLTAKDAEMDNGYGPIPIDDDQLVRVYGPQDLERRLRETPGIVAIDPENEMHLI